MTEVKMRRINGEPVALIMMPMADLAILHAVAEHTIPHLEESPTDTLAAANAVRILQDFVDAIKFALITRY